MADKPKTKRPSVLNRGSIGRKNWRIFLIGLFVGSGLFATLWKVTGGPGIREWRSFLIMPGLLISLPIHTLKDISTSQSAWLLIGSSAVMWGIIFGIIGIVIIKIRNR
ncbi:hypothetical protein L6259_03770 [Candidatus Parcubacteria bacterium]|nr:hypothetical protein [Patescibacteria group bacterium]MCG2694354.1 hypothetical protein [Candidatus Parcubacteria bacterium]